MTSQEFYRQGFTVIKQMMPKGEALALGAHLLELDRKGEGDRNDHQAPNSPSFYGNERLQEEQIKLLPKMEAESGLELHKTYTYARVYKKDAKLLIHKDRPACEISITMDLGGDPWDVYIMDRDERPVPVRLEPGDALMYRGCDMWHWRSKFHGDNHMQVFMHFVDKYGPCAWAKDDLQKEPQHA